MTRVTENEIANAVLNVAVRQPNGIATFDQIRDQVSEYVNLSCEDLRQSLTRKNEAMWEQQIRNIQSHHNVSENFIQKGYLEHVPKVGYRITNKGRKYLENNEFSDREIR